MANHGRVGIGANVHKALHVTRLVGRNSQIIWGARLFATIVPLPDKTITDLRNVYGFLCSDEMW